MNKYLRAISANFLFFIIGAIFFLVITPIAIEVMGDEFYGLWVMLNALMLFSNIGNLGISAIVTKFASEGSAQNNSQEQANQIISAGYIIVLVMSIVTALLLLLANNLITNNINTGLELKDQFRQSIFWLAASILPQFLSRVPYGYLLSLLRNQTVRQIELLLSILLWSGAILIAHIEKNLVYIAVWCFLSNLLVFGLYFFTIQRIRTYKFQIKLPILRKMLNFSKYMFLESLAITMFQQFDKVIIGFTIGPALAGVYSVGTSFALRLSMITGQATEVMIPYASMKETLGDKAKLYTTFRQLSRFTGLAIAGVSSMLIIWMNDILSVWISKEYAIRYASAFQILIIAYSLLSLCRPAHQTLTGMGKVKFTGLIYLFSSIIMLLGLFILSREYALMGAVVSNLTLVILLVFNIFVYYLFDGNFKWKLMLSDLKWGVALPIFSLGLNIILEKSSLYYSLIITLILGGLLAWIITKDTFISNDVRNLQLKKIRFRN